MPLVVLAVLVGALVTAVAAIPPAPRAPRWQGAGDETPRNGGTFVFHHVANIRTLDAQVAYDELSGMALRLVFDALLDYDDDGALIPQLAASLPEVSEDGRTFHFRLRRGVRFHPMPGLPTGRELVADDVRYTLERLLDPDTHSPGAPFYLVIDGAKAFHEGDAAHIAGIEVTSRYGISFRLTEPDQTFANLMAMHFSVPVPKENVDHWGSDVGQHPAGTGPYRFVSWERDVQVELARFARYWDDTFRGADRMIYQENLEDHLAFLRFMNGDLDAIHRLTPAHYLQLKRQSPAWRDYWVEQPRDVVYAVGMNTEMPPFDDADVRRAVALSIDREGWARQQGGRIEPAGQILPPAVPGYDPALPSRQHYDLAAARALLQRARARYEAAGQPDLLDEEIVIWWGDGGRDRVYGELLVQDLTRLGLNARLRPMSYATLLTETGRPNRARMFFAGWAMDFPHAANFFDPIFHSKSARAQNSQNRSFYRNPELDALLDRARQETDRAKAAEMYRQANELVAREAPWAFTYRPMLLEAWQPYVKGYRPHPVWKQDYRGVWLDLPKRRIARSLFGRRLTERFAAVLAPFGTLRSRDRHAQVAARALQSRTAAEAAR